MIGAIGTIGNVGLRSGRLLLYPSYVKDYLDRVRAADGQAVETAVSNVFSQCLQSLVAANLLGVSNNRLAQAASAIKASCFLCGARTLTGCLTPLAQDMPTPTNVNFVGADYNRKRLNSGGAKHILTNINNTQLPQDNRHLSLFVESPPVNSACVLIGTSAVAGRTTLVRLSGDPATSARITNSTNTGPAVVVDQPGFLGATRATASTVSLRYKNATTDAASVSSAPSSANIAVYANEAGGTSAIAAYSFYSVGENLDLSLLESIIANFRNHLITVIP